MSARLTEHFSWEEMTDSSGHSDLVPANRREAESYRASIQATAEIGEQVRAILGVALRVTSGFRGPTLNAAVGGSKTSQHMRGEALDFVPAGIDLDAAFNALLGAMRDGRLRVGQLLRERSWLHVSLGPGYRDRSRCGEYGRQRADGSVEILGRV